MAFGASRALALLFFQALKIEARGRLQFDLKYINDMNDINEINDSNDINDIMFIFIYLCEYLPFEIYSGLLGCKFLRRATRRAQMSVGSRAVPTAPRSTEPRRLFIASERPNQVACRSLATFAFTFAPISSERPVTAAQARSTRMVTASTAHRVLRSHLEHLRCLRIFSRSAFDRQSQPSCPE